MRSHPRETAPHIIPVERDYPATYERFTSIGPLLETIGNGGKGIARNTQSEMDLLRSSTTPRRKARRKASRSWKRPSTPRK